MRNSPAEFFASEADGEFAVMKTAINEPGWQRFLILVCCSTVSGSSGEFAGDYLDTPIAGAIIKVPVTLAVGVPLALGLHRINVPSFPEAHRRLFTYRVIYMICGLVIFLTGLRWLRDWPTGAYAVLVAGISTIPAFWWASWQLRRWPCPHCGKNYFGKLVIGTGMFGENPQAFPACSHCGFEILPFPNEPTSDERPNGIQINH